MTWEARLRARWLFPLLFCGTACDMQADPLVLARSGDFTAVLKALGQFDAGYFMQSKSATALATTYGPDLSSGANIRRAQFGMQGTLFKDWSYFFNAEFGGSGGTEGQGRIQSLYVAYDGLKPFAFRVGAYPPAAGIEDSTGSADTIFLERAAPSDILRNAVGGDGRDGASISYAGDRLFAAFSWTGGKVADSAVFDEQNAALSRISYLAASNTDLKLVLSISGAQIFKTADLSPGADAVHALTLSAAPELTVDSTGSRLISTGALNADRATIWGAETGFEWRGVYAQAGYFGYIVDQRLAPLTTVWRRFDGWYTEASWILTGERRAYKSESAAFAAPKPMRNFTGDGTGWGAWELAARYSTVDLDDNAGVVGSPSSGVRGGDQKIWTLGLNWYPNGALRFALDFQNVDIERLNASSPYQSVGQRFDAVSLRAQFSL